MPQQSEISDLIADIKEQVLFFKELGVDSLAVNLKQAAQPTAEYEPAQTALSDEPRVPAVTIPEIPMAASKPPAARGSRMKALPTLSKRTITITSSAGDPSVPAVPSFQTETNETAVKIKTVSEYTKVGETIEEIRLDIGNCTRCPLSLGRTQIVHTTGNMEAELMFVGEAPGADEDAQGVPFVGRAGKLLTQIIEAIGFSRNDVAIGNINRCRPPDNRQPTPVEAHTCRPFLMREIAVIKPTVIVVLGNTAMHNLLDTKAGITKMRGQFHDYFNVKVMPTFHPAYLLRDPHKKRDVWEDMKMVRDYLIANPKS